MTDHPLRIFTGSAHPQLAQEIAGLLNLPLGKSTTRQLPDSEIHVMIFDKSLFSVLSVFSMFIRVQQDALMNLCSLSFPCFLCSSASNWTFS
jgi:phosphoribosylpyrophosphate synthetase